MSTLVVADPRGVYLAGLEWVLRKAGHSVVANCHRIIDVVAHVERHRPDIVVIGVDIAGQQTASLSSRLRTMNSALGIIFILQPNGGLGIKDIQELNADGLLLDGISDSYLVECVNVVAAGRKWVDNNILQHLLMPRSLPQAAHKLTGREKEIADLVSRGLRNKTIAQRLHVSEGTVKMHLHHVYEKLHLGSRAELAWAAHGKGARE
ncbi:MAG: response regulator transcription factor [Mesorhizobium sp.]|uniref:response regulator transcription factor n=1 Tax=Mesorhizobium sp. TaxID=1871066 RepID=UPI000FC9F303|nr:response regulator transcription factor [Mesorhizobium sp. M5C.F.Cr.IN.023.01.1.1]RWF89244.1 MAG: response regulator transcription factor [Mesorhizobium sp.]RWF97140.1 MAG: response regulator transcription factor [Mesorhizobium sp.]RWI42595.1 MAG: response regulator transcription factor [Mesorhizobium sp.]RWI53340.1 MAG: response regulator transcription factor [Mesorhizobium sp.]